MSVAVIFEEVSVSLCLSCGKHCHMAQTGSHKNTKCVLAVVRSEMLVKHCGLSQKCLKITLGYQSTAGSAAASRARQLGELGSRNVCAPAGVVLAVPALHPQGHGCCSPGGSR